MPSSAPRSLLSVPEAVSAPVIRPMPTDDEAAAILAAVDALWPRPGAGGVDGPRATHILAIQRAMVVGADAGTS